MEYSMLGTSGLLVSRLALGTMTFSETRTGSNKVLKVDGGLAERMVGAALDAGVNLFDTADVYGGGESETVLGKALRGKRADVVLTSKVGLRSGPAATQSGLSRRHIIESVEQSLGRLGTDWIDLYIAHREDRFTPLEETLEALDVLVRSGKVRYLGFSNWSAWTAAAALEMQRANGWARFTHGQMHYSLLGRDVEYDVIPMMQRYGLGLTAWGPLAYGFLTGRLSPDTIDSAESRFLEIDVLRFDRAQGFATVETVRRIAQAHGVSLARVAIAWLLARKAVTAVLLGCTKIEQLTDNLAATEIKLSADELAELDESTSLPPLYPNWFHNRFKDVLVEGLMEKQ